MKTDELLRIAIKNLEASAALSLGGSLLAQTYKELSDAELNQLQAALHEELSFRRKSRQQEEGRLLLECKARLEACLREHLPNVPISRSELDDWNQQVEVTFMMMEELIPVMVDLDEGSEDDRRYPFHDCRIIAWYDRSQETFCLTSSLSEESFSTEEEVVLDLKERFKHMYQCLGRYLSK
jgi:hypothetical protein